MLVRHLYLRESLNVTIHLTCSVNLSIMETKKMSHCVHYYIANPPMETIESRRMSQYIQSKRFWVGFYLNLHFIWLDWIYFVTQSDLFKYWKLSVHPITWFKCTCEVILINLVCLVHCDMWISTMRWIFLCCVFIHI